MTGHYLQSRTRRYELTFSIDCGMHRQCKVSSTCARHFCGFHPLVAHKECSGQVTLFACHHLGPAHLPIVDCNHPLRNRACNSKRHARTHIGLAMICCHHNGIWLDLGRMPLQCRRGHLQNLAMPCHHPGGQSDTAHCPPTRERDTSRVSTVSTSQQTALQHLPSALVLNYIVNILCTWITGRGRSDRHEVSLYVRS